MNACVKCHQEIAAYAQRVDDATGLWHLDCFEVGYIRRHKRRPKLIPGGPSERHVFRLVGELA